MQSHLRKPARAGVVVLMLLAGMMLWLGDPVIWIWVASQTTTSLQAGFGPYMLVAAGILVSTVLFVFVLSRLDRLYESLSGSKQTVRVRLPWMRSMRDEREYRNARELTVFDAVLVGTALMAMTTFVVWFFVFAGSSLPGG